MSTSSPRLIIHQCIVNDAFLLVGCNYGGRSFRVKSDNNGCIARWRHNSCFHQLIPIWIGIGGGGARRFSSYFHHCIRFYLFLCYAVYQYFLFALHHLDYYINYITNNIINIIIININIINYNYCNILL